MRASVFWLASILALSVATPALAGGETAAIEGEWRNNHNTVHFRTHACGEGQMCGTITWASEKAKADARNAGTEQLVGTELFRNMRLDGKGVWRGQVFVPDLKRTFSGSIEMVNINNILGRGCIFAGLICKTSSWTRIG